MALGLIALFWPLISERLDPAAAAAPRTEARRVIGAQDSRDKRIAQAVLLWNIVYQR